VVTTLAAGFQGYVLDFAFAPDGESFVSSGDNSARVWNIETREPIRSFAGATQSIIELSASTHSTTVIAACHDGRVIAWDSATGAVLQDTPGDWLMALCGVPGTNQVLAAHRDNTVRLRDIATGTTVRTFEGHTTSTTLGVAFSPDGRQVLSGGTEAATRHRNRANAQQE
jgi:WD40 repeat protein